MRSGHSRRCLYYPVKKPPAYFLKRAGGLYFPGILPCSRFRENICNSTEVSQVASFRPRRGRTPNNRRWNDRREWNLRIVTDTLLSSPKGANRTKTGCGSPPLGTLSPYYWFVRRFHDLRSFHQRLLKVGPLRGPEVTCET